MNEEKGKALNKGKQSQDFLVFLADVIINYAVLCLQNPDVFPLMLPQSDDLEGPALSALRIMALIQEHTPHEVFLKDVNARLAAEPENLVEIYESVF